ncbi:zinc finger protein 70-like [Pomacea canaliculata]|uniref:zinc finger protein 70-like n=1 Tax=Pomacea canaliculata TaxID=400727 RepID=UPI000D72B698|nr:zinc finger protein 70-like [Pomacea canaliculata]XP_025114888.1 zinc finger protein 70-like [Pomacea canaliculata]
MWNLFPRVSTSQHYRFYPTQVIVMPTVAARASAGCRTRLLGANALCCICSRDFRTARGVLQHVQFVHNLKIFMQKAPFSVSFSSLVSDNATNASTSYVDKLSTPALKKDPSPQDLVSTTTGMHDHPTTFMHDISEEALGSSAQPSVLLVCSSPAFYPEKSITYSSGLNCNAASTKEDKRSPLQKCCSSVVPKKRKRHMKEHDTEAAELAHHEQSALEALASLRSKVLLNQQRMVSKELVADGKPGSDLQWPEKSNKPDSVEICVERTIFREDCVRSNANWDNRGQNNAQEHEGCEPEDDDDAISDHGITSKQKVIVKTVFASTVVNEKESAESTLCLTEVKHDDVNDTADKSDMLKAGSTTVEGDGGHTLLCNKIVSQSVAELSLDQDQTGNNKPASQIVAWKGVEAQADGALGKYFSPLVSEKPDNQQSPPSILRTAETHRKVTSYLLAEKSPQTLSCSQLPGIKALNTPVRLLDCLEQEIPVVTDGQQVQDVSILHTSCESKSPERTSSGESCPLIEDLDKVEGGRKRRRYPTSRPFKCDQCDKAFNQRIHLKKHMSKHTGVKPFKCGVCTYSTVERSHLRAHNRIHTGEKPYSCDYCNYATAQNSTLKIHLKRHHTNKHMI